MKKAFLSILFVAMSIVTFAQQWTSISGNRPAAPQVKLVSSTENQIVVDFSLSGFNLTKVNTPNGAQQIVSVPKMVSMLESGAPDLPQFAIPAIIGDLAEMQVSVSKSDFTDYQDIEIAPSKGNFSRQIDPATVPYTYGAMYNENAFYPATQASLEAPYILRDFRGQNIMVTPFAYNAATKTLRVYHNMTLTMTKVSDKGANPKAARKSNTVKVDPQMKADYSRRFINFGESAAKYTFVEDFGEMLVICPEQYMEAMQPLVDWKNQSGRPTTMVSVAEAGGNTPNDIKAYIRSIYEDPERDLMFILLVGDYTDLYPSNFSGGGYSDNWYGQLEGSDYYVEALTGRFSVSNVTDVETHVNKVLYYERDMPAGLTWLNTGMGIGANEGAGSGHNGGEADYVHINYVRDTLLHYTYETVTQQYSGVGSGTSASAMSADFNNGVSIANYCNHGSQTSWAVGGFSNSHVNALTNDYMWPYIISVACNNGEFNGNCFGEAWLRATNNATGVPTGAIGGMFSWISQPWQPPMTGQDEMVDIITGWISPDQFNHTMGGAFLNGNMKVLDNHPSDNGATYNTWILFGDPSLMLRTDNPTELTVACNPGQLLIGMTELTVSTDAEYAIATLSMNDEVLATSRLIGGSGTLTFAPLTTVGEATLTILAYNKVTYNETIQVIPAEGSFLTVNGYTPNEAHVGDETTMSLSVRNVGHSATSGETQIVLSCEDENMTIINGEATINVVDGETTVDLENAFSFVIAEGVADGTKFTINVTMTCGSDIWEGKATIIATAAVLQANGYSYGNGFVPGEDITLAIYFANVGHYQATNAIATVISASEYLSFENDSVAIGNIDANGVVTAVFRGNIGANCPETEVLSFNFTMVADGDLKVEGNGTMRNSCYLTFELADSYGDGWNGAQLRVSFSDGTPTTSLTITSGSSETYDIEVGNGVTVTLNWTSGHWDTECSFWVRYTATEELIYTATNPTSGHMTDFVVNCGGSSGGDTFDPVENLTANVSDNEVTLTWDAPANALSYNISRNGITIAENIAETSYVDTVSIEASYYYCVVANYAEGTSLPECINVAIDLGVVETEVEFSIYPNPVNGTLFINGDAEYSYVMYNGMGQVVANGTAQGTQQVNVSDMTKGVYFIRLTSGTQNSIQKVVVE